jgi:hypothetical protein
MSSTIRSWVLQPFLLRSLHKRHRRIWIPDASEGFLPGWVKSQSGEEGSQDAVSEVVVAGTGEVRKMAQYLLSPMNPPQFDGEEDIADLTHLNEASVVSNLRMRYGAGSIYVSGPHSELSVEANSFLDLFWVRLESDGTQQTMLI